MNKITAQADDGQQIDPPDPDVFWVKASGIGTAFHVDEGPHPLLFEMQFTGDGEALRIADDRSEAVATLGGQVYLIRPEGGKLAVYKREMPGGSDVGN